jgi:ribonuclease HI
MPQWYWCAPTAGESEILTCQPGRSFKLTHYRPGGYGIVIDAGRRVRKISGRKSATTSNRMELLAAIRALEVALIGTRIRIYTSSQYVQRGITEWVQAWATNGWRTADRKPVKNQDLWRRLVAAAAQHDIEWQWVRRSGGHPALKWTQILAETAARKRI